MSGDVSAAERRWTLRGEPGLRRGRVSAGPDVIGVDSIDVVDVAAFDRVVAERDQAVADGLEVANALRAERDEARAQYHHAEHNELRYRDALEQVNDLLRIEWYASARSRIETVLTEGEQHAGEIMAERDEAVSS